MYIKQEEYLPLAKDVMASFSRDLADFADEDHNYTQAYLDAFQAKIIETEQKEASNTALVQQKQITQTLYLLGENLKRPLKSLRIRIERAEIPTKLTVQVLKDVKNRNFEGVSAKLADLVSLVNSNSTALQTKGMKSTLPQELQDAQISIAAKADEQSQMMKSVAGTIDVNNELYKALYNYISEICEDGKLIYEGEQKADEYTIKKMLTKLHANKIAPIQEKTQNINP
ncbi:hypothetical protein PGH12_07740 [Chryseobacterium wangxinyae]|uniref:hypothetical protein n=1 Tax=Chryseobacterium sp. CY350 TaxID=2997336 RepID=UPI00226F8D16|nr:hypothetical protein [Chryseobacterium sp. CY350]MCY0977036.1 hypothetical protein [Chryseobacterium sp. CY350]WBZ97035.1 hypothetical protein PGH12_07740 [Chryseobacterium sp. CY350]